MQCHQQIYKHLIPTSYSNDCRRSDLIREEWPAIVGRNELAIITPSFPMNSRNNALCNYLEQITSSYQVSTIIINWNKLVTLLEDVCKNLSKEEKRPLTTIWWDSCYQTRIILRYLSICSFCFWSLYGRNTFIYSGIRISRTMVAMPVERNVIDRLPPNETDAFRLDLALTLIIMLFLVFVGTVMGCYCCMKRKTQGVSDISVSYSHGSANAVISRESPPPPYVWHLRRSSSPPPYVST